MQFATPERFCLQRSRWWVGGIVAAHGLAVLAVALAPWFAPIRIAIMLAVTGSLARELSRPWPVRLELGISGIWSLLLSDGSRRCAPAITGRNGPLGVICITLAHGTVTDVILAPDAFADGNQSRLRALLRHRQPAMA